MSELESRSCPQVSPMTQPVASASRFDNRRASRREFLAQSLTAGAVALPTIVSARALGLEQAAARGAY